MPNPYAIIGGLVLTIALVLGAFFYGQHLGYQSRQAEETTVLAKQFQKYAEDAKANAKAGTEQALADFNAKTAVLDDIAKNLETAKGIMNNAASRLASSLRNGACVLSPGQRLLLECIRRPGDPRCVAPASP